MNAKMEYVWSLPMTCANDIPILVPIIDDMIHCEPVFAVMSAKFSCIANVLWIAALDALAAK